MPKPADNIFMRNEVTKEREKQYYIANKERVLAYSRSYYLANKEKKLESSRLWYAENRDRKNETNRIWKINNIERWCGYLKKWQKENPEKMQLFSKNYREKNPEKIRGFCQSWRDRNPNYEKNRRIVDINFKLAINLRKRLYAAFKNNYKTGSAVSDLGCTIDRFRIYLESMFQKGMAWGNYGSFGWHIDHKIPLTSFNLTNREQFKKACHYTNLQPLWWKDNLSKGTKLIKQEQYA